MFQYKWQQGLQKGEDAANIREKVFVEEQGFEYSEEFDKLDEKAFHVTVLKPDDITKENIPVACGRVFLDDDNEYHLGRIAVVKEYRKFGIGRLLINEMIREVKELGGNKVVLSAQDHAIPFYEKLGFKPFGAMFSEHNIPHMMMKLYM